MAARTIVTHAAKIHELSERMDAAANADGIQAEDLTDASILREARWLLEDYCESGHQLNDALIGDEGVETKRLAQAEVRALRAFIKRFGK